MSVFKGLKVVELASVLAGPAVGMFFAELGANVIKIENKKTNGDVTRNWKSSNEKTENTSAYFSSVNWGKEHLFLDYTDEKDFSQLLSLCKEADVIICNFKYGDAQKFNLSYLDLKKNNKKVIYAQLNGFKSQPERVAFDVVLQAECGYMYMNGQIGSPPTKMPLAMMDLLGAHQLKEGVLLALLKKEKTGKGSLVETSLEEAALSSLANQATNWLMNQEIPQRLGSMHPNIAPYGDIFTTKDNKLLVTAIGSNKQFASFCNLLERKEIATEDKFSTNQNRLKNRIALQEILGTLIRDHNRDELITQCIEKSIPIGGIKNMKEVFSSKTAQNMLLEEIVNGEKTTRIKSIAFKIS
jgi:crotonobetainyl-CoA:carnitine CoA-transferase CaiB-like acyl-CoA transferase